MSAASTYNEDASFGRPCAIGAAVGFVVMTIGTALVGRAAGFDDPGALGIAILSAIFGGLGFGAMFGAIYAVCRLPSEPAGTPEATTATPEVDAVADAA